MSLAAFFTVILLGAPPKPEGPVAVLPFKNLNEDAALSWLERGISETMVTDLRKSGRLVVVERDQIEQAMAEIALQGTKVAEEAGAVRAGKLVGARTVVVGSFQKAGNDLRINARFVAVETGVVLDSAKETGAMAKVFTLQDRIVDRLLGVPKGAPPPARPVRSGSEKAVESYRLYAQSLDIRSDAQRVALLQRSIEIDPGFTYAVEDLAALQKRIEGYARTSRAKLAEQDAKRLAVLDDGSAAASAKSEAAVDLLESLEAARRYTLLAEISERVLALRLPRPLRGATRRSTPLRSAYAPGTASGNGTSRSNTARSTLPTSPAGAGSPR